MGSTQKKQSADKLPTAYLFLQSADFILNRVYAGK